MPSHGLSVYGINTNPVTICIKFLNLACPTVFSHWHDLPCRTIHTWSSSFKQQVRPLGRILWDVTGDVYIHSYRLLAIVYGSRYSNRYVAGTHSAISLIGFIAEVLNGMLNIPQVAVTGAGGQTGGLVVKRLLDKQCNVLAIGRSSEVCVSLT